MWVLGVQFQSSIIIANACIIGMQSPWKSEVGIDSLGLEF